VSTAGALIAAAVVAVVGAAPAVVAAGVVAWSGGARGVVVGVVRAAMTGGPAGAVTVAGGESLAGLDGGVVLEAELLEDEEGAGALEVVRRELGGDHRLDVAVPGVEAAEEVEHLARLGDGVSDVTEAVGDALQLGAVVVHRQIALLEGAQLRLEEDGTLKFVVAEELLDGAPEREGVGDGVTTHDVVDALGDGLEDPVGDAGVDAPPLAIAVVVRRKGGDVILEPELAKGGLEELAPLAVVAFIQIKHDRNVVADGESLDLGGGGADDRLVDFGGGGGIRAMVGGSHESGSKLAGESLGSKVG
jgi:hypothetical protein